MVSRNALVDNLGNDNSEMEAEPPLPAFICPITQEIMEQPMVTADGHSYSGPSIAAWLFGRTPLRFHIASRNVSNLRPNTVGIFSPVETKGAV